MRRFQKNGHEVTVVMTRAATRFIAPLTFETFAPGRVFHELFAAGQDPLLHINLSKENDLLLVAPATANIIGKMANGIADDLLSTLFCAFFRGVVVAPAMNTHMLENPAVDRQHRPPAQPRRRDHRGRRRPAGQPAKAAAGACPTPRPSTAIA